MAHYGDHICGVYYMVDYRRAYLPQVKLESQTTITPVSFTTELRQIFKTADAAPQVRYTFPLYDGITVSGYKISYNEKVLTGVIKQKDDAKKTYQDAVDRGETAGLLESLPAGVFGVTLGNVPAQTELLVNVTYCGELKHDAGVDGLRYILPTSVAPRYGSYPGTVLNSNATATSMRLTVDVDMGPRSAIRKIQSPSHPIAVTMGGLSSSLKQEGDVAAYSPSKASATLSQESAELNNDFILQVVIDDLSRPQAVLENHPTIPNQRAIMATLVPKFVLEPAHPEVVFIADQSGSMSGSKNAALVAALKVFLKSLPFGVRFNVCAFGNAFQFLWKTSQAYNEDNVTRAIEYVEGFHAHLGGTELLKPIQAAFERHLSHMPLEVLVLTDGQIWQEQDVFEFVSGELENGVDARVFTLGIGQDVSHTLVEGLARVGNGFAQFVTQNEDTDQKVIRMLKGALYAHTKDYELEVVYSESSHGDRHNSDDDDFEMIEKLQDCLTVSPTREHMAEPNKPRSFFDKSADLVQPVDTQDRYAHLPQIVPPKLVQTPSKIPPLFPYNRTTIYILLDEHSSHKDIKSVVLRARSAGGLLELEIPISCVTGATSVHQLAARKAIQDLEESRGWLHQAKIKANDHSETTLQLKHAERFDEIVEREAVRLGEKFQVASKWTSFVAVQDGQTKSTNKAPAQAPVSSFQRSSCVRARKAFPKTRMMVAEAPGSSFGSAQGTLPPPPPAPASAAKFGCAHVLTSSSLQAGPPSFPASASSTGPAMRPIFAARTAQPSRHMLASRASRVAAPGAVDVGAAEEEMDEDQSESADNDLGFGLFDDEPPPKKKTPSSNRTVASREQLSPVQEVHEIIGLQAFTGAWKYSTRLLELIDQTDEILVGFGYEQDIATTALVVAYLELNRNDRREVWDMVVGKARDWLAASIGGTEKADELIGDARNITVVKQ